MIGSCFNFFFFQSICFELGTINPVTSEVITDREELVIPMMLISSCMSNSTSIPPHLSYRLILCFTDLTFFLVVCADILLIPLGVHSMDIFHWDYITHLKSYDNLFLN